MPFPGYPLDTTRTNSTPMTDRHPLDHEQERTALNDLQAQIDSIDIDIVNLQNGLIVAQSDITAIENALTRTQVTLSGASQTLTAGPGVYTKAVFTTVGVEAGGDWISVPSDTITVPETGFYMLSFRFLRGTGNWGSSNFILTLLASSTWHFPPTGTNNATITWCGYLAAGTGLQLEALNPSTASTFSTIGGVAKLPWAA